MYKVILLIALFLVLGCTEDNENINNTSGGECSQESKNQYLYDTMKSYYFWYEHIPNVNPTDYSSMETLLEALTYKTYDRWSYITTVEENQQYYEEGTYVGVGFGSTVKENRLFIRFVFQDSPAFNVGLQRGDEVLEINGKTILEIESENSWSSAFGESKEGAEVHLKIKRGNQLHEMRMSKRVVTIDTVLADSIISVGSKKVGYFNFKTFISPSKGALSKQFTQFQEENVDELVLDLRYNGGGRLSIAKYLADLIIANRYENSIFETLVYNDKHSNLNYTYRFGSEANSLGLKRLYVLTDSGTASASETVINGLRPYVDIVLIGAKTHGKPVGMSPKEHCGKVIAAINFKGVNAEGYGDYFGGMEVTCQAEDDLTSALGNPNEAMLKEALYFIEHQRCSTQSMAKTALTTGNNREIEAKLYQGFRGEIGAH
jgi:carboxyl-terminal processing protease